MHKFLSVSAVAVLISACGPEPVDKAATKATVEKSVRESEAAMVKSLKARDVPAVVSHYAHDAIFMTPGAPPAKGVAGVESAFREMVKDPELSLEFAADRIEVADSGDLAVARGPYTLHVTDPMTKKPVTDRGSFMSVYRKQTDGAWKIVLDINVSEVASPPEPEPKSKSKRAVQKKAPAKKRR